MLRTLKNKRGFTLIELVIIIILLGVLAAIAIPRYVDMREHAIKASAQATLDGGRAGVQLDFADQMLNQGTYSNSLTDSTSPGARFANPDVNDLEAELQPIPNYPPNGPYDDPGGRGFRWWLVTQGSTTAPVRPPVIDAVIDLTCAAADSGKNKANDDCLVSRL